MIKTIDPLLSESRPQQTAVAPSVRSRIEPDDLGLRRAQVGLLYESLPTALLATVACAVTLVVAEWDVIPHVILLAWLAAMSAISAGRWGLAIAFRRSGPAAGVVPWEQAFLAGTALAGAGWGATAWALFPDDSLPHQFLLVFVLGVISAGATVTLAPRFTAFLCLAVPTLLPIIVRLILQGEPLSKTMVLYVAIFTGLMVFVALRMSRTVARSLELQFENKEVVGQLLGQIEQGRQMDLMLDIDREHFRFAIEQASDIICRTDLGGHITFINPAVTRLLGYSETEILGHRFTEFVREDYRQKAKWFYGRQFARRRSATYLEIPLVAKTGREIWVGQNSQLLVRDEEVIGFQAVVRDISVIKQAEQALRASEEKLQSFFHDAPIMYFTLNSEGTVLSVNRSGAEQLGYTISELVGRSVLDVFLVEDQENVKAQMAASLANPGVVREWALRKVRKDGVIIQVHERARVVPGSDGRPVVLVVCQDITQRVRQEKAVQEVYQQLEQRVVERTSELLKANEALRQTTAHLQTLIAASPLAIIELDTAGKVVSWNAAATRIFGWTEDEVLGLDLPYVSRDQKEKEESARLRESIMLGASPNVELRRHRKDGSMVDVNFWGVGRRNAAGRVIGVLGFLSEITHQKRLEQQFRQAQKMEAVGRLAGGVAHDFNNLLTVINGCSALLLDQVRPEDPMHVLLDETLKAGERAADLTRQLLAFSRQQVLKLQRIDLNQSLTAISSMLKRLMGEDIELAVQAAPDLWPIQADKGQIDQVMMNLAVNARDAMPEGGTLTITTANYVLEPGMPVPNPVFTPGEYVHVAVRDTGHGMDQDVRSHLFEPFYTTKEEGKGTGLGLATVYGIIKQSSGFIFVDSVSGKGTTFDLYFPRFIEQDTAAAAILPRPRQGGERLLLVEDQHSVRELVCKALEGYGYQVFKAANGEEALRLVAVMPEPVDVLVTDVVMPRMTGPVVAERLRAHWPGLRVLFMSGYTERVKPVFLNSPGTLFIQKPFLPTELAAQLRRLLDEPS